ncbi:MAG: MBL fold metallo-hydrolase [Myxococcota bacterium]|nr:hypothetical protein [Spirochaeta sp.]RPG12448.1 MAG: MBL fold metallo-hydrolase [Proteobacteria bacterium TMED72]
MEKTNPPEGPQPGKRKRRQEQEDAATEVTEVAPDVLRMQLPISMPGLGHVNCYALLDEDGATLVDPGLPSANSFRALEDRLGQAGLRVEDCHTVVVTHSHPDHFGGASRVLDRSQGKLVAHHSFYLGAVAPPKPEVAVDDLHAHEDAESGLRVPEDSARAHAHKPFTPVRSLKRGPTPWGGNPPRPPFKMRARMALLKMMGRSFMSMPTITHPKAGGDVIRLGKREFFIVHTPGHTEDHICLHDPENEVFLAGDHVLPSITPHISGLSSNADPLQAFFDSLVTAAELKHVSQILPAHGHPFDDLAARCGAIREHHDERLIRVKEIGRELGPASVNDIMKKLFRERSWGAMAESETYAHVEHLRLLGEMGSHRDDKGYLIYEV